MRQALPSRATKVVLTVALLAAAAVAAPLLAGEPDVAPGAVAVLEERIALLELYAERRILPLVGRGLADETPESAAARFERALDGVARRLGHLPRQEAAPLAARLRELRHAVRHHRPSVSAPTAGEKTPGEGLITGLVTSAVTGEPLDGAHIEVVGGSSNVHAGTFSDGTYSIPIFSGTYAVVVEEPGGTDLLAELYDDLPCPGGAWVGCDPKTGTPVVVQGGSVTSGIDVALEAGGSLGGTVVDLATGEPLPSAEVTVFDADGDVVSPFKNWTDANGEYTVDGLGTGDHYVLARHFAHAPHLFEDISCGPGCDPLTGTPVAVTAGAATEGIDFALPKRGRIEGRLTDARTGQPIFGIVRVSATSGSFNDSEDTDANGRYVVGGLLPGAYYVRTDLDDSYLNEAYDDIPCPAAPACLASATVIDLEAEEVVPGIDFALRPLGRIAGRVTDLAGNPLPDALVQIRGGPTSFEQIRTNALGEYLTLGLLPGSTYRATASGGGYLPERFADVPCWFPPGCEPTDGTPISVEIETVTSGIDFSLAYGNVLSGRLSEAGTGLPLEGRIQAMRAEPSDPTGFEVVADVDTDAAGFWSIVELVPGDYRLHVSAPGHRTELWDDQPCVQLENGADCSEVIGTLIALPDAGLDIDGLDSALDRLGTISGRITDAVTGAPLNAGVAIETTADSSGAVSNWDGVYVSPLLPPGTYRLLAWAAGYLPEIYSDIACPIYPWGEPYCPLEIGTPVSLGISQNLSGIDFGLLPTTVFEDGFESGDVSGWATARP